MRFPELGNLKAVLTCLLLCSFSLCFDEALAKHELKILKVGNLLDVETGILTQNQEILIQSCYLFQ